MYIVSLMKKTVNTFSPFLKEYTTNILIIKV